MALLGELVRLAVAAAEVEELVAEGDGVVVVVAWRGRGRRCGRGLVGVGVGLGEGVLEVGRTWQLVAAFAAASLVTAACAVAGMLASMARVRKLPPTTLSAVARMCPRRMKITLSPLLIRVNVCSWWVRRRLGDGWVSLLISGVGSVMRAAGLSFAAGPPWRVGGPAMRCDGPRPPIGSVSHRKICFRLAETPRARAVSGASRAKSARARSRWGGYRVPTKPRASRPGAATGAVAGSAE